MKFIADERDGNSKGAETRRCYHQQERRKTLGTCAVHRQEFHHHVARGEVPGVHVVLLAGWSGRL